MKRKKCKDSIRKVGNQFSTTFHLGCTKTPEAETHTDEPAEGELVCKFQRPMAMGGMPPDFPTILVYNEDRSIEAQLHNSPEIEAIFGPDDIKAYAVCELEGETPVPQRRVKAQNW